MTTIPTLILASGSPYRRELLNRLNLPFETRPADIDETSQANETARELALRLAREKAAAVAAHAPGAWVIGSDQTLAMGDPPDETILGKPGNHERAVAQLQALSGQQVRFYTSLCLISGDTQARTALAEVEVRFRKLSLAEIERYLQMEPAYDCAGSCKAEGLGITMVESIKSDDPTALIGLPLIRLCGLLADAGLALPAAQLENS